MDVDRPKANQVPTPATKKSATKSPTSSREIAPAKISDTPSPSTTVPKPAPPPIATSKTVVAKPSEQAAKLFAAQLAAAPKRAPVAAKRTPAKRPPKVPTAATQPKRPAPTVASLSASTAPGGAPRTQEEPPSAESLDDAENNQERSAGLIGAMEQNLYSLDSLRGTSNAQIMVGPGGNRVLLESLPLAQQQQNTRPQRGDQPLSDSAKHLLRSIHTSSSSFVPGFDVWPEADATKRCWHCAQVRNVTPVRTARAYHDKHNVFTDVHGWFCSTACRSTYAVERNRVNFAQDCLVQSAMDDRVLGLTMAQSACRAPPSHFHEFWGGPCSDEDFVRISQSGLDEDGNPNSIGSAVVRHIDKSLLISSPAMFELTCHEDHGIDLVANLQPAKSASSRAGLPERSLPLHPEMSSLSSLVVLDGAGGTLVHKVAQDFGTAKNRQDDDNLLYTVGTKVQKPKFKVGGVVYDANYADGVNIAPHKGPPKTIRSTGK